MSLQQRIIIAILVVGGFIFWNLPKNSTNALTNGELDGIISKTTEGFITAENKILGGKPIDPDDTPKGPHPDPDKCICNGTGKIVQGDGHVSPCPYHSGEAPEKEPESEPEIKKAPVQQYQRQRIRLFPRLFGGYT
jgi:hypothetical protein